MSYRGMGQVAASVSGGTNWAGIERFARTAAGGMGEQIVSPFSSSISRAARAARMRDALVALADTIAVRPQAMFWLAQPASRHREGLLAIANLAARSARASGGTARTAPASAPPASTAPASASARVEGSAASTGSDQLVARVRAELSKPRASWHRDLIPLAEAADRALADRAALRKLLADALTAPAGDGRVALAVLVVRAEDSGSPSVSGLGRLLR